MLLVTSRKNQQQQQQQRHRQENKKERLKFSELIQRKFQWFITADNNEMTVQKKKKQSLHQIFSTNGELLSSSLKKVITSHYGSKISDALAAHKRFSTLWHILYDDENLFDVKQNELNIL